MAILFNGANSIELPNITIPVAATGIVTHTWWMRADSLAALQRIWGAGTHNEARIALTTGLVTNDVFEGAGGTASTSGVAVGTWTFIAMTADANADTGTVYFNGALEVTGIDHTGTTVGTSMSLGTRTGSTDFFTGALDDWRMYDRLLPTDEIETIFALRGNDGIRDGLIHRFTFREGAPGTSVGTTLADDAGGGGGVGGILTGTPVYEESELKLGRMAA